MKNSKLRKLGIAIAAAAILTTSQAFSYEVSPETFLSGLQTSVSADQTVAALAAIDRLRAIGVIGILINGRVVTLEELEAMLQSGDPAISLAAINALVSQAAAADLAFVFPDRVAQTVTSPTPSLFPTSSAG
jgi:hypothetical protein